MITRRRAVQLSLLAAFWPSFVSDAWAASSARPTALFDAHRRAVERGRPLLVLMIARDDQRTWHDRGQAFGALLNHGGDEALAAFALCEVVCGEESDVAELAGQPVPAGAAYALIETDQVPARVRFAGGPAFGPVARPRDPNDWARAEEDAVDLAIRAHRDAVVAMVIPDRAALARYVAQAEAVDAAAVRGVRATVGEPDPGLVARAPAALALLAADGRIDRALAASALAELGRESWVAQVVPGSRWAYSGGCGTLVEGAGDDQVLMACGMGHVSAKATRMLYFYEEPR